jgi:hypothetical protein
VRNLAAVLSSSHFARTQIFATQRDVWHAWVRLFRRRGSEATSTLRSHTSQRSADPRVKRPDLERQPIPVQLIGLAKWRDSEDDVVPSLPSTPRPVAVRDSYIEIKLPWSSRFAIAPGQPRAVAELPRDL